MKEKKARARIVELVHQDAAPQRLDKFLAASLPGYTRSRLQKFIKAGLVSVDSRPASKAGQMLEPGMTVQVAIPPVQPSRLTPEHIPLDIIFENQHILVIDKPAGMVVHPSAGHRAGTLVNAALAHAPEMEGVGGEHRPGVVHRLDKDTSGVIVLAKNDRAHQFLQQQFRDRKAQKVYLALVDGHPPTPAGVVEAAIGRDNHNRKRMAVTAPSRGRAATTEYHTLERFDHHTLLEVHPLTGRTHQIRVHLAFLGCPIVGDRVYGRRRPSVRIKRHFLHAARLTLTLPGETEPRTFQSPLPPALTHVLRLLRARG